MATRLNPSTFGYQNFYSSTLTSDITSGTLTIGVGAVPTPSAGILVLEPDSTTNREVILYTSKGASTVTCPSDGRGYSGSTAASHLQGSAVIMAPIDKWFTALASGELSSDPLRTELFFDFVASGCVWSGDSYGSTRNASMTSGVIYIQGRRLTLAAVTARTFTASKDTYIDVADSAGDGTGTITYTEVANNAASPALASNNVRIGIIVTAAGSIAAAGSVNQGEVDKVLPIASSIPYSVTDSLGNLICPRDPMRKLLGYRQRITNKTATTLVLIDELSITLTSPSPRKVKIIANPGLGLSEDTNATQSRISIWDGTVGSGTQLAEAFITTAAANQGSYPQAVWIGTLSAGSHTINAGLRSVGAGTTTLNSGASTTPAFLSIELL